MKISKKLNLTIPLYGEPTLEKDPISGKEKEVLNPQYYVHSTPISQEVFERYYAIIGQAFNQIHAGGLGILSGSKLAAFVIRDLAEKAGVWEGEDGVENGLINEISRLTTVFAPSARGWTMIPLDEAIRSHLIDADDAMEVRNAIAFFTLMSSMVPKRELPTVLLIALRIWGARLESLSCTEFLSSLPTSKGTVPSTAASAGLSVPS